MKYITSLMSTIEDFVKNFPTIGTQQTYRSYLRMFFHAIDANPESYFKDQRNYENDVQEFWKSMAGKPPKTTITALSTVKSFLAENDVELPTKVWKNIRRRTKGNRAVLMDTIPTNNQLKRILQHGDAKSRALFLIASSSGMRINEIISLEPGDLDMNHVPVKINIRGETTKTGNPRIAFISNEAKEVLEEWLKQRDSYLQIAVKRNNFNYEKSADDNRIFPFSYDLARQMWIKLITKAGFDKINKRVNRHEMHIHTLRKYFRTRMSLEIPVDVVEALMGHEGYLTQVYRRYTEEQLVELYQKAVRTVTVFETTSDERINKLDEQLKTKDTEIKDLKQQMHDLRMELLEVKMKQVQELQRKK